MRALDRLLRRWRIAKAVPWIRHGDRLLDVGCFDRSLIERVAERVHAAVGVDPLLEPCDEGRIRLLRGQFPEDFAFSDASFDCITALAVLEHVPEPERFARECHRLLAPGGRVVLTVPHPAVDRLVDTLRMLRLLDAMSLEEHHGFDVERTQQIFSVAGLRALVERPFQLGLNRLFIFERPRADTNRTT
jgi:2-polyprenyl-3-methyl-5-hydroxy-6-metoxy-1,4-benzoquinol methylase